MDATDRVMFRRSTSGLTVLAHSFGILSLILLLFWLLHYRGGLNLESDISERIFNVHPFMMFFGLIFLSGEGMMAYKTIAAEKAVQKFIHMLLHLIAICMGIIGIHAVLKFHNKENIEDFYSLHSWVGIATFSIFLLQWLVGFVLFMFPKASPGTRARALPWHICGGRALLYMAISSALTGLMEKATLLGDKYHSNQARTINFLGLSILLFGIFVDFSLVFARYV
ncbi:hypothetical protein AAG906_040859 [Vitis piasezkii]